MSLRLISRAVAVLMTAAVVAGCADTGDGSTNAEPTSDLNAVKIEGAANEKPAVDVPKPFAVSKTGRKVLTQGKGAIVAAGQRVSVNYLGVNGTDGKEFDTSFGKDQAQFTLDGNQIIPGLVEGLEGTAVGSRVLVAVPPAEGYGTQGVPAAGIGPTDTILFVVDIAAARNVLKRATGDAVTPKAGLPAVKLGKDGSPTITLPEGAAPKTLAVQTLITGTGPKVAKGQDIVVHYTGVVWPGGKVFDSSWTRGAPASFAIGANAVIAGWDEGLVGQPVGSQVLLVVPPDKGYGAGGNPQAGIKGTDTLVFVVDILDAS